MCVGQPLEGRVSVHQHLNVHGYAFATQCEGGANTSKPGTRTGPGIHETLGLPKASGSILPTSPQGTLTAGGVPLASNCTRPGYNFPIGKTLRGLATPRLARRGTANPKSATVGLPCPQHPRNDHFPVPHPPLDSEQTECPPAPQRRVVVNGLTTLALPR